MQTPNTNSPSSSVAVVDRVVVLSLSSSSSLSSAEVVVVEGSTVASSRLVFVSSSPAAPVCVEVLVTVNVCVVVGAEVIAVSSRAPHSVPRDDMLQQHGTMIEDFLSAPPENLTSDLGAVAVSGASSFQVSEGGLRDASSFR